MSKVTRGRGWFIRGKTYILLPHNIKALISDNPLKAVILASTVYCCRGKSIDVAGLNIFPYVDIKSQFRICFDSIVCMFLRIFCWLFMHDHSAMVRVNQCLLIHQTKSLQHVWSTMFYFGNISFQISITKH